MDPACVRRLSGKAEVLVCAPVLGKISLRVETADRHSGDGRESGAGVFVELHPGSRSDWLLRSLLEGRKKRFFRPLFLRRRRTSSFKGFANGVLRYAARAVLAVFFSGHEFLLSASIVMLCFGTSQTLHDKD